MERRGFIRDKERRDIVTRLCRDRKGYEEVYRGWHLHPPGQQVAHLYQETPGLLGQRRAKIQG